MRMSKYTLILLQAFIIVKMCSVYYKINDWYEVDISLFFMIEFAFVFYHTINFQHQKNYIFKKEVEKPILLKWVNYQYDR